MKLEEIKKIHGPMVKIAYDINIVNAQAKINAKKLVATSERCYHDQIDCVISEILQAGAQIVKVSGPSAAGKTTSAVLISKELKKKGIRSVVISLDDFFLSRDKTPRLPNGDYDFENITALNHKLYKKFISTLFEKGVAEKPIFDFHTGTSPTSEKVRLKNGDIVIIEGIHALNPILSKGLKTKDYSVYVSCEGNYIWGRELLIPARTLRLMRRVLRDYYKRGTSVEETLNYWGNVCRGENEFINPFKVKADFIVDSTHIYEPLLYDTYLQPIIKTANKENPYIQEFLHIFSKTGKINKSLIPANSLIWEVLVKDI